MRDDEPYRPHGEPLPPVGGTDGVTDPTGAAVEKNLPEGAAPVDGDGKVQGPALRLGQAGPGADTRGRR